MELFKFLFIYDIDNDILNILGIFEIKFKIGIMIWIIMKNEEWGKYWGLRLNE